MSPRIYTVAPLALIYFYVWGRLSRPSSPPESGRWSARNLIAYFAAGSVVALLYYQLAPQWIIAGWALAVVALIVAALLLDQEIFLEQTVLLTAGIAIRGVAHNVFGSSYFTSGGWRGKFSVISLTSALLFATLPIAFSAPTKTYCSEPKLSGVQRRIYACRKIGVATRNVNFVLLHQPANYLRIERIGMKDHAHTLHCRQPESSRESEGMEEGEDAKNLVASAKHEHLGNLADVRHDVEMR
jgi:hypothetical protein